MSTQLAQWSAPRTGSSLAPLLPIAFEEGRRRPLVLAALFAVVALVILAIGLATPKTFTASTTILVEESNIIQPLMEGRAVPTAVVDRAAIAREVAFSRKVMNQVLETGGWLEDDPSPLEKEALIDEITGRTEITNPRENPNLIKISYSDSDPQRAFAITQRIAQLVMQESSAAKQQESRKAFEFISSQVGHYRGELAKAETRLAEYRRANPDARPGTEEEVSRRIAELRTELDRSRMDLVDQSSQAGVMQSHLAREASFGASGAVNSQLRSQLAALQTERNALSAKYTDQHPDIIRVQQQIDDLQAQARNGGGRTAVALAPTASDPMFGSIRGQLAEARSRSAASAARIAMGQTLLAEELERSNRIAASAGELGGLMRDFEINRTVYQDLLDRRENARLSMNLDAQSGGLNFRIQEPATVPLRATGLRLMHVALAGLVLAVALPLLLLLGWVKFDTRVRSSSQIEQVAGLPVLGSIPMRSAPARSAQVARSRMMAVALLMAVPLAYALALTLR